MSTKKKEALLNHPTEKEADTGELELLLVMIVCACLFQAHLLWNGHQSVNELWRSDKSNPAVLLRDFPTQLEEEGKYLLQGFTYRQQATTEEDQWSLVGLALELDLIGWGLLSIKDVKRRRKQVVIAQKLQAKLAEEAAAYQQRTQGLVSDLEDVVPVQEESDLPASITESLN